MPSSSDEILAKEACALLESWGRTDLAVSPEQVLRWRQADFLPVLSDRLGGRGRPTAYAPEAVQVVAAIAIELASFRNLDQAAVSAFVQYAVTGGRRGGPVPLTGLRRAGRHYISELEELCRRARAANKKAGGRRSAIPRKLRVPFPSSRRAHSGEATDAILSLALGQVDTHELGTAFYALADKEGLEALDDEPEPDMPELRTVVGQLALGALKLAVLKVSYDDLRWGCQVADVVLGFATQVPAFYDVTRADVGLVETSLPRVGVRVIRLGRKLPTAFLRNSGPIVFILGIFVAMVTSQVPASRRELSKAINEWAAVRPGLVLLTEVAHELPEHWRPALAPITGMSYFASLDADEREALLAELRKRDCEGVIFPNMTPE